jgi:undecaprenyl-diphosphatase
VDALQAIVLGIVQGLTEFLPISSSGHLRIVPAFFGWDDPGAAFTAVIQLGTMAAVLLYFRKDLWRIASAWLRSLRRPELRQELDARMGWYIIAGTVPISVFGLAFSDQIENEARNLYLIGTTLIVLGVILYAADRGAGQERDVASVTLRDAVIVGFAQALALIPGVSRSGATITAGLLLGFDRASAARYSFLLSVPAVVLSGLFEMRKIGDPGGAGAFETAIATLAAFIVGYASIAFLLRWVANNSLAIFVWYRVALGALVLEATAAAKGNATLAAGDFAPAFLVVAAIAALSGFIFPRLAPDAGAEMSGHQAVKAKTPSSGMGTGLDGS